MPSMWRSVLSHVLLIYKVDGDANAGESTHRAVVSLAQKQVPLNIQRVSVQAAGMFIIDEEGMRPTGDLHFA